MVDADTLNTFKYRLDKHWLDQDVLYNFYSELSGTGGASICMWMWCCKRYGQTGITVPFYSHWIGLDWILHIVWIIHWKWNFWAHVSVNPLLKIAFAVYFLLIHLHCLPITSCIKYELAAITYKSLSVSQCTCLHLLLQHYQLVWPLCLGIQDFLALSWSCDLGIHC